MSWTETSPFDHAEGRVDLGFLRFLQLLRMARWLACSTQAVEIEGVVAFFGARGLEMVLGVWIVLHDRKWEWDGDVGFMHGDRAGDGLFHTEREGDLMQLMQLMHLMRVGGES